jgi:hypothetical protein
MLDRSRSRDRSKTGGAFSPAGLFANNEQGAWYDPSDFSTLYQDSTGTTPVTAVEQPVGLMLDRSRGLVLGAELRGTGVPALSGSATAATYNAGTGAGTANRVNPSNQSFVNFGGFAPGSAFVATVQNTGSVLLVVRQSTATSAGAFIQTISAGQTATVVGQVSSTGFMAVSGVNDGTSVDFTVLSLQALPGNHASQATSASRPVLRSRYNLLTRSEQFDNAAWTKTRATVTANTATSPDGTMTADSLIEDATASNSHFLAGPSSSLPSYTVAATVTASAFVKIASGTRDVAIRTAGASGSAYAIYNLSTGLFVTSATSGSNWTFVSSSITALANGWYRIIVTGSHTETSGGLQLFCNLTDGSSLTYTGDGTSGILIWGAQLLTAADQTSTGGAYQRIAAATDYDTSNPVWRPYLAFDGTDDFMSLASAISITTDMTVLRGFGRSAAGIRSAGLGPASGTEPRDYFWQTTNIESYGLGATAQTLTADTATGYFVGTLRRSATDEFLRRNGTQISTRAAPAVSGSFTKLGDLSGNLNNGPIYGLIVLDRELTGSELTATEQWMAGKTGATLA